MTNVKYISTRLFIDKLRTSVKVDRVYTDLSYGHIGGSGEWVDGDQWIDNEVWNEN